MTYRTPWRGLPWLAALLLSWLAATAWAQPAPQGSSEADPPGRVAHVSARHGEVVYAPDGEEDWVELPQNRPLTNGDRLWADRGARAELQLDTATLHIGGETHVGVSALDEEGAQLILEQGSMHARVREMQRGDNFEIDTPNVAVRVTQPGEYRVDVDDKSGHTRVAVLSGSVTVFGDGGQSVQLAAGQTAAFTGRALASVQAPGFRPDELTQWAAERNRAEEQSVSARYVPRGVIGYSQLDQHGQWDNVPEYGAVWYPRNVPENWAPYRQGQWSYVRPWGWTWVDEAPWGFAPFHYGRWAQVGNRWAWVPGRLAPRPVYSPALVVFAGGGPVVVRSGPGVAWYPLAPGEAWWPTYRVSTRYVGGVNFGINLAAYPRTYTNYYWARRPFAVTAVSIGDFRLGRPVFRAWSPVGVDVIGRARIGFAPDRPTRTELVAIRGGAVRLSVRPARVQPVAGAHFAAQRRPAAAARFTDGGGRGGRDQAGGRDRDERAGGRPAPARADNERGRPSPRSEERDRPGRGADERQDRPGRGPEARDERGGGRGPESRQEREERKQDRPGRGPEAREERGGGRNPEARQDRQDRPARAEAREERRGPEGRQDRPGRGPEARDAREERGAGRGPEARQERQDRPGRGPEAREERGGGRGPEARQERQERVQQQRPEREQPQRAEREQPQREQRGGGGGGRGRDRDDEERGGGRR